MRPAAAPSSGTSEMNGLVSRGSKSKPLTKKLELSEDKNVKVSVIRDLALIGKLKERIGIFFTKWEANWTEVNIAGSNQSWAVSH